MKNDNNVRTQMQGQAGVYAVTAQLILHGFRPLFPAVDSGADLVLDNGLRLQVKTGRLFSSTGKRIRHPLGAYQFDTRCCKQDADKKMRRIKRDYSQVADFFVFWGIDENRFWVVPTSELKGSLVVSSRAKIYPNPQYAKVRERNAACEDNWDALSVGAVSKKIIESADLQEIK